MCEATITVNNQREIVAALRQMGASVVALAGVGFDVPDLLVGFRGCNYLFEVKAQGRRARYTSAKDGFMATWRGQVATVRSLDDALAILELSDMEVGRYREKVKGW